MDEQEGFAGKGTKISLLTLDYWWKRFDHRLYWA